jgi:hypothetical protein
MLRGPSGHGPDRLNRPFILTPEYPGDFGTQIAFLFG